MDLVWMILKWVVLIVVVVGGVLFFYIRHLTNRVERTYFKNGVLQSEYPQRNFKIHGLCKRYYENGDLEFEGYYEYDLPCGEQKTYYENGVLKEKSRLKIVIIQDNERKFRRSVLDGEGIIYDENGGVVSKIVGRFENNLETRRAYQINNAAVNEFAVILKETIHDYNTMTILEKTYHSNNVVEHIERRKIVDILYDTSKLDGLQEFYNEWGELEKEEVYQLDCFVEKREYENGKIRFEEINLQNNDQEECIKKYYHVDGTLRSVVPYVDRTIHGIVEIYDNNGRLKEKTIYQEGMATTQRIYYENGNLFFETPSFYDEFGLHEEGSGNGIEKIYYENGKLRSLAMLKNRIREGQEKMYRQNGEIYRIREYDGGNREGTERVFNKLGRLKVEFLYKNGLKNGTTIAYKTYEYGGIKICEVPYKDGEIDGLVKTYYSDGSIKAEILFENGEKKSTKKYKEGEKQDQTKDSPLP